MEIDSVAAKPMWPGASAWCVAALVLIAAPSAQAVEEGLQRSVSPPCAAVSFGGIEDGDIVGPSFAVQFVVEGMDIAPAGTDRPNSGHHHLLIDLEALPSLNLPLPANEHIRHFGKGQTETTLELPPGQHTLQLMFADYLHIPHDPPVMSQKITITVSSEAE